MLLYNGSLEWSLAAMAKNANTNIVFMDIIVLVLVQIMVWARGRGTTRVSWSAASLAVVMVPTAIHLGRS